MFQKYDQKINITANIQIKLKNNNFKHYFFLTSSRSGIVPALSGCFSHTTSRPHWLFRKEKKRQILSDGFPSSRETCFYLMGSDRLSVLLRLIRKIGQSFNPQRSTPGSFSGLLQSTENHEGSILIPSVLNHLKTSML